MGDSGFNSNEQMSRQSRQSSSYSQNEHQASQLQAGAPSFHPRTFPMTQVPRPQMISVDHLADRAQQMSLNHGVHGVQTVVCQYCSRKDQEIGELKGINSRLKGRIRELESSVRNLTMRSTSIEERPPGFVAHSGATVTIHTFYGSENSHDARASRSARSARSFSRSSSNSSFESNFRPPNN